MRQKKRITGVRSPPKSAANIILVRSEERPFRFFLCVRHMATKVVKFGGSSLADAKQIQKAAAIIKADPERRYVVPSAPGKRFSDDIKVTDMLYTCYDLAEQGLDFSDALDAIQARYNDIISGLGMDFSLQAEFSEIAENFKKRAQVMSDYFSNIQVLPDLKGNGPLTLGENLADHGGLKVAFQALQNAMKENPLDSVDGFTPNQRFFIAYANVWGANISNEEIRRRTKSDPHSLGRWRVNGALPHIDEWYQAFNVTDKNKLFVPKDKRVTIW